MPISTSDPVAGSPEAFLKTTARAIGFDGVRIARADAPWHAGERLEAFVADGRHGQMAWMETTLERRKAPTAMWAGAKSAVVVALNYGPGLDPMEMLAETRLGNISVYARGKDYHDLPEIAPENSWRGRSWPKPARK